MKPDPTVLLQKMDMIFPLIGVYHAPDPAPFEPVISPEPGKHICVFQYFESWLNGRTVVLTRERFGCGGCGHWMFGLEGRSRSEFVKFLVDTEGLKASRDLMNQWLDHLKPYQPVHGSLMIGPLKPEQFEYLKTVTFFANPDQLSLLLTGAQYHHRIGDPPPVIASFGSGCMQLLPLVPDSTIAQALIGATDIAMRQYLPKDILALTVTPPMFERLCSLNETSFLFKPFWKNLRKSRGLE